MFCIFIQKESLPEPKFQPRFLASTLCTLLSSQRSDASGFPSRVNSRATFQVYRFDIRCQPLVSEEFPPVISAGDLNPRHKNCKPQGLISGLRLLKLEPAISIGSCQTLDNLEELSHDLVKLSNRTSNWRVEASNQKKSPASDFLPRAKTA